METSDWPTENFIFTNMLTQKILKMASNDYHKLA